MQDLRGLASRMWPFATAAAISGALFWGIAAFAQRLTVWLLRAESLPHRRGLYPIGGLPLVIFFAG